MFTIKTPELRQSSPSGVFTVNFQYDSDIFLFLLLMWNEQMLTGLKSEIKAVAYAECFGECAQSSKLTKDARMIQLGLVLVPSLPSLIHPMLD